MVYIIPNFLVLHFGENFMKIRTKIEKLKMHENLHKTVNENMSCFVFIHIFMQIFMSFHEGICYSFTLLISYMVFNPFKMAVQFF